MFGDEVRARRRRTGWTQEQLAEASGLSVRSIRKLESGRVTAPRLPTVQLLAGAFRLTGPDYESFCRSATTEPAPPAGRDVPAQLPHDAYGFVGREAGLAALDDLRRARGVAIGVVSGVAGVGKTALAVHWAHRVAAGFPDGQLHADLRGFDPGGSAADPAEVVRGFLSALGVEPQRIPGPVDAQAALYRSLLAGKRVLIVLDNARDSDQVRPLLPGTGGCLVVVTSRDQLGGLVATSGAQPVPLDLMSVAEARALLAERLGEQPDAEATDRLVAACARLPLALVIASARARENGSTPASLAAGLRIAEERLDVLDAGDAASQVRAVFSWSYDALTPAAARLFRLLSLHPGPDLDRAAAAGLDGRPAAETRRSLTELIRAGLLTERFPGRYAMHDLLRAYASERARQSETEPERHRASTRMLDFYLATAYAGDRILNPGLDLIALVPAAPGLVARPLADEQEVLTWFRAERPVLLALAGLAFEQGFDQHAWQLAWALWTFLFRQGHWHELAAAGRVAVEAGRRLDDPLAEARAHRLVAHACTLLGRFDDSYAELTRALELAERAGDKVGQAHTHTGLGHLVARRDDVGAALSHARSALTLYQAAGHRLGEARAFNAVGWYSTLLGDHHEAIAAGRDGLRLADDDPDMRANILDTIGHAHQKLGESAAAIDCYTEAAEMHRKIGNRYYEALIRDRLGDTCAAAGRPDDARAAWERALALLEELDHADADALREKLG